MNDVVEVLKAVSDPTRMRILMSLLNGELCVCRITELLDLSPSTISKHLSVLKHAKLLKSRKEGKWIYFELNLPNKKDLIIRTIELLKNNLEKDVVIKSDLIRLRKILKMNSEKVCRC